MREILFKAKRIDTGEWVEGYYQKRHVSGGKIRHFIFWSKSHYYYGYVVIDPETLCQYTGLKDRDGNRIWENDIVRNKSKWGDWTGTVVFENGSFVIKWKQYNKYCGTGISSFAEDISNAKERLGNIFDNTELLERS